MKIAIIATTLLMTGIVCAQTCEPANSQACINMRNAQRGYDIQQKEQERQRMLQYQKDAGNHVQGPTEVKAGPVYVSPSYSNGSVGVQGTMETK